jgi:hypothetical protein
MTPHYPAMITRFLLEGPRCVECIATKCSLTPTEVTVVLETIGKSLEMNRWRGECIVCGDEAAPVWCFG